MGSKVKTKVIILTRHYRIVGHISLLPGSRLTDYLREADGFVAVTDAEVWDQSERKVSSSDFLDINCEHVEIIMPENSVTQGVGVPLYR